MPRLVDMDVLIVDAQTTGASPAFGVVLELGWGVARASRAEMVGAEARWIQLPAGRNVPWQVAKLTGYDPAVARAEAIEDHEAWQRLRAATAFAAEMPTAIHYARFELAFLREWAARFAPERPFPLDAVCVHAIARRLYPDLPRRSLRALAGFLGGGVDLTRRSLGHVQGTAFVWGRLCEALAARGIVEWAQLKDWLAQPAAGAASPESPPSPSRSRRRRRYPIAAAQYRSLPDQPGVYRFLRANGDLLYVGKAASLRKRVASHFAGRPSRELSVEMLTQVSDIRADVAASALEAALLENETIKALRPPYNVALVAPDPRVWFSDAAFASATQAPDESHGIGPLPSEFSLAALRAQIALLSGCPPTVAAARAAAVGTSALWTPDEAVFAAGWATFLARHAAALSASDGPARARLLRLAAELLASRAFEKAAEPESEAPETRDWDPERVARHLERAAAQAYLTYRRSRWLRLLFDSDVVYREPGDARARRLRFRAGQLIDAANAGDDSVASTAESPEPAPARFDRATYDRLRILTTELRRLMRDGGQVWMRPRRSPS
ncbi:MAG TPA: GIY-YIG nuclease family protein [Polyangia bacterium]|nr:GIY-YIG nuclease family protein [Polyangia bacterium]